MKKVCTLAALVLAATAAQSQASFVAFNDLGGNSSTGTTSITVAGTTTPGTTTGLLKDYATNANTGITLTVTIPAGYTGAEGDSGSTNGLMGNVGTPAYNVFGTAINALGYAWYNNATTSRARFTFSGAVAGDAFTVSLFGNRASSTTTYPDRYTVTTIGDVDGFTNTSSVGAAVSTVSLANDTARVMTGNNTATGTIAQYSNVNAGADGTFYIDVYGTGTGNEYKWYLNAISVTAVPEPTSLSLLGLGTMALIRRRRA